MDLGMAIVFLLPAACLICNLGLLYYFLKHLWHIIKRICNIREKYYETMTGEWVVEEFDTFLDVCMVLLIGSLFYFCYRY